MDFSALAQTCGPYIDVKAISAIVRTESNFNPLVIGINGNVRLARQPKSKAEAVATARWLIDNGYNVDLGLGQINYKNLESLGLTVSDVFDPCKNIAASAAILKTNYVLAKSQNSDDWTATLQSISAYNTGSFTKGFLNGYVQKVIDNATDPIPVLIDKNVPKDSEKSPTIQVARLSVKKSHITPADNGVNVYGSADSGNKVNIYGVNTANIMIY